MDKMILAHLSFPENSLKPQPNNNINEEVIIPEFILKNNYQGTEKQVQFLTHSFTFQC